MLNESKYSMPWVRCAFGNVSRGKLTWLVKIETLISLHGFVKFDKWISQSCVFDNVSRGKLTWLVSVRWLQPQGQVDLNSSSSAKEKMIYKHKILNTFQMNSGLA